MSTQIPIEPGLHLAVERSLGTGDMRLIYGLGAPFLTATALIVAAIVTGAMWLVAIAVVAIVAMAVFALREFDLMLGEEHDEDEDEDTRRG